MKKLVKLDENYRLTDIDWKATMRQAIMVQEFIKKKTSYEEREKYDFEFNRQFISDSVLNKTIEFRLNSTLKCFDPRIFIITKYSVKNH